MAYISQENKVAKAPKIKKILKKYSLTGSLSIDNYSTLVLTIRSGSVDFFGEFHRETEVDHLTVNEYWYQKQFTGIARECLQEIIAVMNEGNHNNSDLMTDYFDVGWYIEIRIGNWKKAYKYTGENLR